MAIRVAVCLQLSFFQDKIQHTTYAQGSHTEIVEHILHQDSADAQNQRSRTGI